MKKTIGIGISDFKKLRKNNYLFIDKSLFIQDVVKSGAEILLIPRPRRFGKTLNLSMLRYFFEYQQDEEKKQEMERLFDGLFIRATEEFKEHFCRYPVIFLTFKDVKKTTMDRAIYKIRMVLREEVLRHIEDIDSFFHGMKGWEVELLNRIKEEKDEQEDWEESLLALSRFLHRVYKRPCVILIDEYDTPIHAAWQYGYYDEMVSFMRGLLSGGLKDNPHIYKGVITGILRVAKESIFSDLNNLDIYTIVEKNFCQYFGITTEELKELFKEYNMEDRLEEVDSWYNGYIFGDRVIFNPWSILNFINRHPSYPEPYWANTSSNILIKDLIVSGGIDVRDKIKTLIAGDSIESVIDKNIVFPDLHKKEHYIYSLFFFSGYLKCVDSRLEEEELYCTLSIPNREVRYIFRNIISTWLEESFGNAKLTAMLHSLVQGNIDKFERLLNEFIITTLSFFDTKGKNPESVYQAFVLGMLLNLGSEYEISSNRELGYGRYDILCIPRKDKNRYAILMEMKSIAGFYKEDPDKAIKEAVEQINSRGYAKELRARGFDRVLKLVVVSDGKKVWVRRVE